MRPAFILERLPVSPINIAIKNLGPRAFFPNLFEKNLPFLILNKKKTDLDCLQKLLRKF